MTTSEHSNGVLYHPIARMEASWKEEESYTPRTIRADLDLTDERTLTIIEGYSPIERVAFREDVVIALAKIFNEAVRRFKDD